MFLISIKKQHKLQGFCESDTMVHCIHSGILWVGLRILSEYQSQLQSVRPAGSGGDTKKVAPVYDLSYYWSGRIRVYKNKPCAVRINTRIHADLSSFDDKSSERFDPRQTAVCRLNPHVPNRKLKPPHLRRFEFSGRGERIRTFDILLPKQALYQTELRPETRQIISTFLLNANFYMHFMLV